MKIKPFIITCAGMSGSKWLAHSINQHSHVSCSHSAGLYNIYNRDYDKKELENILAIEREQFSNKRTIKNVIDDIDKENSLLNGNVHSYRLYRLKEAMRYDNTKNNTIANLIRHPLSVTLSRTAMFNQMAEHDVSVQKKIKNTYLNNKNTFQKYVDEYHLDINDYKILSYFDALVGLHKLHQEVNLYNDVFHIQIEKTKEYSYFREIIEYISGGKLEADEDYLSTIIKSPVLNSHTHLMADTLNDKYNNLLDWEKELFLIFIEKSNIYKSYEKLGYDFNFMTQREKG